MGTSEHARDLDRALTDMRSARSLLLHGLRPLDETAFAVGRAGGWTVGRVAQHLVESDVLYVKLLAHQVGGVAPALPEPPPADGAEAAVMLEQTRDAIARLAHGIDAETLYRMVTVGHEEYSPLSLIENITMHDGEHLAQIEDLLRPARPEPRPSRGAQRGMVIREGREGDLVAINDLYNHYIRETPITFDLEPWTIEQRREWFARFSATGRHRLLVAEIEGAVAGFACTGMFRPKQAYETSPEVTIYCAPGFEGRGVGTALYARLFEALQGEDIHSFVAGITLPNDASCRLHERFGFKRAGVFHGVGRKFGRFWDVAWYERLVD